eukprot:superscaffoldBa00002381_g14078
MEEGLLLVPGAGHRWAGRRGTAEKRGEERHFIGAERRNSSGKPVDALSPIPAPGRLPHQHQHPPPSTPQPLLLLFTHRLATIHPVSHLSCDRPAVAEANKQPARAIPSRLSAEQRDTGAEEENGTPVLGSGLSLVGTFELLRPVSKSVSPD